jgi:hypothetical protein
MSLEHLWHCSILHSKPDEKREEKENKNYDCFFLHNHPSELFLYNSGTASRCPTA